MNIDSNLFISIDVDIKPILPELKFKEYTITRPNGKVIHCSKLIKPKIVVDDYQDELSQIWQNNHSEDSLFWNVQDEVLHQKRLKEQNKELDQ